jgi:hypothetical protein
MVCIHSFTPRRYRVSRLWHVGILWDSPMPQSRFARISSSMRRASSSGLSGSWGYWIHCFSMSDYFNRLRAELSRVLVA